MAITLAQSQQGTTGTASTTTLTLTLGANTTVGNCLVVVVNAVSSSSRPTVSSVLIGGVADNFAQAAKIEGIVSDSGNWYIYVCPDCQTAATAVKITTTGGSGSLGIIAFAYEFSGIKVDSVLSNVLDQTSTNDSGGANQTTFTSGATGTTAQAGEAWIGAGGGEKSGSAITAAGPSSPWVNLTAQTANPGSQTPRFATVSGYQITSSTGAATYSGTLSTTTTQNSDGIVITLLGGDKSPALTETGAAADALTVASAVPLADSGASAEAVTASLGLYDSGAATETAGAIAASVPLAETGLGTDVLTVNTAGALADAGTSAEAISVTQIMNFPSSNLAIHVELLINGVWTDITSYCYARQDITITRGRPNETSQCNPSSCSLTLNNRDGRFSPKNLQGTYYPYLTRNTQIRVWLWGTPDSTGLKYRFWGEVPAWPQAWDKSGNDVWAPIQAAGILRRLTQSNATIGSALYRYVESLTGGATPLVAYWPCQDGAGSTQFASGLPAGVAGTWTGTPALGSNSGFPGSDALPAIQGSTWIFPTGSPNNTISGSQTWSANGTFTWTAPTGITSVTAQCWGPGGRGGNTAFLDTAAGGGGGGEYASDTIAVTPGSTYTLVVGLAGQTPARTSTFTGDAAAKVTAHGGVVGSVVTTGGAGGTGSTNATHYDGGAGGSGQFDTGSGNGEGGGGGGSAGTTGAGNAGTAGSTSSPSTPNGAVAVTGGGPGGQGGSGHDGLPPPSGPGGGGGGAESGGGSTHAGGAGWDGQVTVGWSTVAAGPASSVIRFALMIPAGGGISNAVIASVYTGGTIGRLDVVYTTGGHLALNGYSGAGGSLFGSGAQTAGADGQPLIVDIELAQSGGNVAVTFSAILPGAAAAAFTYTTTVAGTVGYTYDLVINPAGAGGVTDATSAGQVMIFNAAPALTALASPLGGYEGETAATRFQRLCNEEGIPVLITGTASDSEAMGAQADDTLINLLQACEDADRGLMFEPRTQFGLGYRTRASLLNQAAAVVLDYPSADLGGGDMQPTEDDALTRNDVVLTRSSGSTARQSLTTGAMSTQSPPNGVGDYNYQQTINCSTDAQLADIAGWVLHLGTINEPRYPMIPTDLARSQAASVFGAIQLVGDGDYVQVTNPPLWLPPGAIRQLAYGFTEVMNARKYTIAWNCVPERPFEVVVGDSTWHADTDGATLAGAIDNNSTTTSLQVTTPSPYLAFTTTDVPFGIIVDGERMTVTAVSGASSPQTFTVVRGIDGTIIAHAAGAAVAVDPPPIAGI